MKNDRITVRVTEEEKKEIDVYAEKENMNRLLLCVYILNIIPSLLIKEFNYSIIYL